MFNDLGLSKTFAWALIQGIRFQIWNSLEVLKQTIKGDPKALYANCSNPNIVLKSLRQLETRKLVESGYADDVEQDMNDVTMADLNDSASYGTIPSAEDMRKTIAIVMAKFHLECSDEKASEILHLFLDGVPEAQDPQEKTARAQRREKQNYEHKKQCRLLRRAAENTYEAQTGPSDVPQVKGSTNNEPIRSGDNSSAWRHSILPYVPISLAVRLRMRVNVSVFESQKRVLTFLAATDVFDLNIYNRVMSVSITEVEADEAAGRPGRAGLQGAAATALQPDDPGPSLPCTSGDIPSDVIVALGKTFLYVILEKPEPEKLKSTDEAGKGFFLARRKMTEQKILGPDEGDTWKSVGDLQSYEDIDKFISKSRDAYKQTKAQKVRRHAPLLRPSVLTADQLTASYAPLLSGGSRCCPTEQCIRI